MRGHVRRRGRAWAIVVDARGEDGRRRRRWISGTMHGGRPWRTRKEAEGSLPSILGKLNDHRYLEPSTATLGEYLAVWLERAATRPKEPLRPATQDSYRRAIAVHVLPALGSVPLQKLRAGDLSELYGGMLKRGLSKRTVRYTHSIVHKALADACRDTPPMLAHNVADGAEVPSAKETQAPKPRVWTATETRAFFASVTDDRLSALWILLGTTGMRRGEAIGLRRQDVDLDGGKIAIRQALVPVGSQVVVSRPKTDKSSRDVHLDGPTTVILRAHLKRLVVERLRWGPAFEDHGLVFAQENGRPLVPGEVSKTFRRLVKKSGLPPIRLHDLRHSMATAWLEAGVNPLVVSERLGHASPAFTMSVYQHVRPQVHQQEAARVAEGLFGPGSGSR